jgi:hypothetical protein
MKMGVEAAIIGGASLVGTGAGIWASDKASKRQEKGAEKGIDAQLEMYYQSRADMMPWLEGGERALGKLETAVDTPYDPPDKNALRETPGYQFRFEEGQKAVGRRASARGGRSGGRALKELTRYGQDYASTEYDKEYTRGANTRQQRINNLLRMSGMGESAGNMLTSAGTATGRGVAAGETYGGDARASGYINTANAVTGGLRSGVQDYMFYNYLKKSA